MKKFKDAVHKEAARASHFLTSWLEQTRHSILQGAAQGALSPLREGEAQPRHMAREGPQHVVIGMHPNVQ